MLDRANTLLSLIAGIALGARNLRLAELPSRHHAVLLGDDASDSMLWRMLGEIEERGRRRITKAKATVRAHVWKLLADCETGFPWLASEIQLARWI